MQPWNVKERRAPGDFIRAAVELCGDCETCRDLIEQECRAFPELYRLYDEQLRSGIAVPEQKLRELAGMCTYCGLCPCPEIPAFLMEGKALYAQREGLPISARLLADVPGLARACGTFPRVISAVESSELGASLLRKIGGIHRERRFPAFARESFFAWAARKGLAERSGAGRQTMYFAGCTAGYLFPEIGRAVVNVLQHNGVRVYVPAQRCCGMPHLVEGDQQHAVRAVRDIVVQVLDALRAGDDVICSCPTCGFLMKVLLKEKAYYSEDYQRSVNSGPDEIRVPGLASEGGRHVVIKKGTVRDILKDDGCFSSIPAMDRIAVAEHVRDAGEYLGRLRSAGRLDVRFSPSAQRVAYFAPCHQRQQKIGRPYLDLLRLVPDLEIQQVGETECCGMGGNFGFKDSVHAASLAIGRPVFERIEELAPDAIVTDCVSCRLQLGHALRYPVLHPMELLATAYGSGGGEGGVQAS